MPVEEGERKEKMDLPYRCLRNKTFLFTVS
jgi:hypothetical protein